MLRKEMMSTMAFTVKREPLMGDNLIPSLSSALSDLPELSKFSLSHELSLRNVYIVTTLQSSCQQNLPYISITISARPHVMPTVIIIPFITVMTAIVIINTTKSDFAIIEMKSSSYKRNLKPQPIAGKTSGTLLQESGASSFPMKITNSFLLAYGKLLLKGFKIRRRSSFCGKEWSWPR